MYIPFNYLVRKFELYNVIFRRTGREVMTFLLTKTGREHFGIIHMHTVPFKFMLCITMRLTECPPDGQPHRAGEKVRRYVRNNVEIQSASSTCLREF